jgi:endogenous inhibitor of DNA gyrase (YacG/DUF329 family)
MSDSRCPVCSKPSVGKWGPFCSKRCADVDLSRWLRGGYAIPGRPAGEDDENASEPPKNSGSGASD